MHVFELNTELCTHNLTNSLCKCDRSYVWVQTNYFGCKLFILINFYEFFCNKTMGYKVFYSVSILGVNRADPGGCNLDPPQGISYEISLYQYSVGNGN